MLGGFMAHKEFTIDNTVCKRRFHFAFDDTDLPVANQTFGCPLCKAVVFSAKNHAPVRFTRLENLVNQVDLSDRVIHECACVFE
jgi:hypothetical protein